MNEENEKLLKKAKLLIQEQLFTEASVKLALLLKNEPQHLEALSYQGLVHAQLREMEDAKASFLKALAVDNEVAHVHNNLANVYKALQQFDLAMKHYQQAIEFNPEYAQAHHNLATLFSMQKNEAKALHHYAKAVNAQPDFISAHYHLGLLFLQRQDISSAIVQFQNVLTLSPEHLSAQFYLGVIHLDANELALAETCFQNILNLNAEHVDALANMGVIALKREQGQLAIDYFTKALALDNEHIEARNNLAATFIHHDRFENALIHYQLLLEHEPDNLEYLYNAGVAEMSLGLLKEAIIHFKQILNHATPSVVNTHALSALNNLAAVYLRLGQKSEAIDYLKQTLLVNPKDNSSQFMLDALTGTNETPDTCPEYAKNLFNNYALYYDQHMRESLKYALPHHIAKLLYELVPEPLESILELGCGTGLTGSVLKDFSHHLVGVDISEKMLTQARNKEIYDEIIHQECLSFLREDTHSYSMIVATDVLPYLGDLGELFSLCSQRLKSQGLLVLTTEINEEPKWKLQENARFSHHPDYLSTLAAEFHFTMIYDQNIIARYQNQEPVYEKLHVFLWI